MRLQAVLHLYREIARLAEWIVARFCRLKGGCVLDMNLIGDGIYQGGCLDGVGIEQCPIGIDAILNLSTHHDRLPDTIKAYAWMPIIDGPPFPGVIWLDAAVDTVSNWNRSGWKVLIHCSAGISRSGMVDVAYWMKTRGLSLDNALKYVRQYRPATHPNKWFMGGLLEYQRHLERHGY